MPQYLSISLDERVACQSLRAALIEGEESGVSFGSVAQVLRALGVLEKVIDAADALTSDIGRPRAGRLTRRRAR